MQPFSDAPSVYLASAGDSICSTVGAFQVEGLGAQRFACIVELRRRWVINALGEPFRRRLLEGADLCGTPPARHRAKASAQLRTFEVDAAEV